RHLISCCNATATPYIYTLSLHDALPIYPPADPRPDGPPARRREQRADPRLAQRPRLGAGGRRRPPPARHRRRRRPGGRAGRQGRSEEHTSELQSRENLVCRLLLEKKKQK